MPWEVPITIDGLTYPVRFNTEEKPTQVDIDEAVAMILKSRPGTEATPTTEPPVKLEDIAAALKQADAAGDTEGAKILAEHYQKIADASDGLARHELKFRNENSGTMEAVAALSLAVGLVAFLWFIRAAKARTKPVTIHPVLNLAHRAFAMRLLFAMAAYGGATFWLNNIRQTAAIWLVWILVGVQLFLFLTIFVVCSLRAKQCGFRHTWLLFIPLLLSRVNDWELIVIPSTALLMFVLSSRHNGVSGGFPVSWVDLVMGAIAWVIVDEAKLIPLVIHEVHARGETKLWIGGLIGCGSVALGIYVSRAIRRVAQLPSNEEKPDSSSQASSSEMAEQASDVLGYELLSQELDAGKKDAVLWLKSFSEANGDEAKAQAAYNRARAAVLARDFIAKEDAWRKARESADKAKQSRLIITRS